MNAKHRKTIAAVFARPTSGSIKWRDIEAMLMALGASASEGRGSRVKFTLNGHMISFHRPHPAPDTAKGAVRATAEFLIKTGYTL